MKKNIIIHYTGESRNAIIFDEATMEASFFESQSLYSADGSEREILINDYKFTPKIISYITLDEICDERIVIRNKNIRLKSVKHRDGYANKERWTGEITPYTKANDRVLIIDLINKKMIVKYGRVENEFDFKDGASHYMIKEFIRKSFMKFTSAVVIPEEDDFFKKFRAMFEHNKKYSFILEIKNKDLGIKGRSKMQCGFDCANNILHHYDYKFNGVRQMNELFSAQLSGVLFMINNPGVESLMNSPYCCNLYQEIFLNKKTFPDSKLNKVLGVEKTTMKMMNTIVNKITENISSLSSSECNKQKIHEIISPLLYKHREKIDSIIDLIHGYNNLEYLLNSYFENQFYLDYLSYISYYYMNVRWHGTERGGELQFKDSVCGICKNIISIFKSLNVLLNVAPNYLNNINYLSDYLTSLCRKQGFQKIESGIELLIDYISIQKTMNAEYEKYPSSIHIAHDVAANNFRFFNNNESFRLHCKGFLKAVAEYTDLDYINRQEDFIVIHPGGFEDMFVEGCSLNHCVASYIPEVAAGKSKIMFIRKQSEREIPYFTVEIRDNVIKQVKGLNQVDPSDAKLKSFITTWSQKRGLEEFY